MGIGAFGSFLDQSPTISSPPARLLADTNVSEPYEVDEHGILLLENGSFAYIAISGCSCWPDRGGTEVVEADSLDQLEAKVEINDGEYSRAFSSLSWKALVQTAREVLAA